MYDPSSLTSLSEGDSPASDKLQPYVISAEYIIISWQLKKSDTLQVLRDFILQYRK